MYCSSVVVGKKRKQGQQYTPLPWTSHFDGCNDVEVQSGVISLILLTLLYPTDYLPYQIFLN